MFLLKSPRDQSQVVNVAKQVSPYKTKYFMESFMHATRKPYSYLLLDLHQEQSDHLRLRTNIFKDEWPMVVYLEK